MGFNSGFKGLKYVTVFFQLHYGPGVDSASKRNEYEEYFLKVKAVGS